MDSLMSPDRVWLDCICAAAQNTAALERRSETELPKVWVFTVEQMGLR